MQFLYKLYGDKFHNEKILDALINKPRNAPIMLLRNLLKSETKYNNREAMLHIYGRINHEEFSQLKSKLKIILVKSILISEFKFKPNSEIVSKTNDVLDLYRDTLASRILIEKGERIAAISLLERSIKKSIAFELSENIRSQAKLLSSHYSLIEYDRHKYTKFIKILDEWTEIDLEEQKLSILYNKLFGYYRRNLGLSDHRIVEKIYRWKEEDTPDINTSVYKLMKFNLNNIYLECVKDYDSIIQECNTMESLLIENTIKSITQIQSIYIRKLWATIQLKKYKEAISEGINYSKLSPEGSIQWYILNLYVVKASLYQKEYIRAFKIFNKILNLKKFKSLNNALKEIFDLTLGYLYLIKDSGIDPVLQDLPLPEFRMARFLNSAPIYSKDKSGMNISILLLQIAFMLQKKNFIKAADRIESLRSYASKYLRRNETFRSNCMMKMIMEMAKADFNPRKTERYTATLRAQLDEMPLHSIGGNIEVEVIPFEDLWEIIMRSLEK